MNKQKFQGRYTRSKITAGMYLYRGYTIQKEDMSENDVYPPSTVRWEIVKHDTGGTTCFGNSATLKKGTIDVDQLIDSQKTMKHKGFSEEMQPTMEACALTMEKFMAEALNK